MYVTPPSLSLSGCEFDEVEVNGLSYTPTLLINTTISNSANLTVLRYGGGEYGSLKYSVLVYLRKRYALSIIVIKEWYEICYKVKKIKIKSKIIFKKNVKHVFTTKTSLLLQNETLWHLGRKEYQWKKD